MILSVASPRGCCANAANPPLLKGVRGIYCVCIRASTATKSPGAARLPPLQKGDLQRYFSAYGALPWAIFLCPVGAPRQPALRQPHGTHTTMDYQASAF